MHLGSTSIKGLTAKPTIDISVAVYKLKDTDFYKDKLSPLQYVTTNGSKFENWILWDRVNCGQKYHLHLMQFDSMRLFQQVLFKIFLEEHKYAADLYARKKEAWLSWDEHIWYSMNKKPFLDDVCTHALCAILEKPLLWKEKVESVMGYNPFPCLFEAGFCDSKKEIINKYIDEKRVRFGKI
jgi:GrpB-like predicted nucleotidyltransferase (UPF0157 family)